METFYTVPSWAGKPVAGLHLDVTKDGKLIQKLMIDEKKCYLFGRNPDLNDFGVEHASCSRVHAALVFHKHLERVFLVDLNSTHGTFVGNVRIEGHKPTQIPIDCSFHFGASTRFYTLREKPFQVQANRSAVDCESKSEETDTTCVLPDDQSELDNLTEFNTAHNKRISMLRIAENDARRSKKRSKSVAFKDEEEVINPEDVDPTIGKFRNLVQTSVIPNKKVKPDFASTMFGTGSSGSSSSAMLTECDPSPFNDNHTNHYSNHSQSNHSSRSQSFASNMLLGKFQIPNPAPDIDLDRQPQQSIASAPAVPSVGVVASMVNDSFGFDNSIRDEQQRKKKYAKEAWPGRKPPAMSM